MASTAPTFNEAASVEADKTGPRLLRHPGNAPFNEAASVEADKTIKTSSGIIDGLTFNEAASVEADKTADGGWSEADRTLLQ